MSQGEVHSSTYDTVCVVQTGRGPHSVAPLRGTKNTHNGGRAQENGGGEGEGRISNASNAKPWSAVPPAAAAPPLKLWFLRR